VEQLPEGVPQSDEHPTLLMLEVRRRIGGGQFEAFTHRGIDRGHLV
jgi:hypothetical protein